MEAVRLTNDEALLCKFSAAQNGLLPDSYVQYFLNQPHHRHTRKHAKPPIINRGTFLRTVSIDSIVRNFILKTAAEKNLQILSLGAGFDTRFFRLTDEFKPSQFPSLKLKYFEIDFESVIATKESIISDHEILQSKSSSSTCSGHTLKLIAFDLNSLSSSDTSTSVDKFNSALIEAGFDFSSSTLIIAECCFMYLTAESGNSLISWSAASLKKSTICSFDPILADNLERDPFAQVMLDNLEDRGLDSRALLAYPSTNSVSDRFRTHFASVNTFTMLELEQSPQTRTLVSDEQRHILNIKAALDEYEEWRLLASHYLLVIATKDKNGCMF